MKIYLKTKDYAVSGEEFSLMLHEDLELLQTQPVPDNLKPYYEHESYISHTDRSRTVLEKVYQQVKKISLRKKESWLKSLVSAGATVLDVGAGTGSFVSYLKSRGWQAEGVEPNSTARDLASRKGTVLYQSLTEAPRKKYDVITLWHVLEHLEDLEKGIEQLLGKLDDEGVLFVAVPNFKSYDAQYYKMYWAGYDVPRHLWHFSPASINKIFKDKGWQVVDTKPMLFDSFYVSLLSERYRNSSMIWWRACWRGLRSNLNGWRSGQYSSLVYILRKTQ